MREGWYHVYAADERQRVIEFHEVAPGPQIILRAIRARVERAGFAIVSEIEADDQVIVGYERGDERRVITAVWCDFEECHRGEARGDAARPDRQKRRIAAMNS